MQQHALCNIVQRVTCSNLHRATLCIVPHCASCDVQQRASCNIVQQRATSCEVPPCVTHPESRILQHCPVHPATPRRDAHAPPPCTRPPPPSPLVHAPAGAGGGGGRRRPAAMDSTGKEREAVQLMAEAEKRVKGSHSFLRGLFGGNTRVEEACEMYTRAANMFKIAKNWSAAGNAFCQAAKLHMQLQSKHDSATSFVDAGNAYKKADPQEAINCLNAAIDIYTDMGRFTIAAKHHITIAEIYEAELVDIEKAIAHYEQAADYYKGEESNSSANKCLLKVAAYAAQLEQYQKAIEIYEQVGTNTMDNPLLKYSAKEYFFKAALCHFIVDELNAKLALEKYEEMFPAFTDSRECKLLKKLLEAHEEQNCEAYTEAVKEFDSISRLDQWLTTMLLRIKKSIQGEGDGDLK
ncbi:beta-soluble NSF attachment protein isoform 2-T2 [Morphnus guianensis]